MKGHIRHRGKGSWEITIDLGKDAEGRRLRKFVNIKGKKADADRYLRELLTSLDKGLPVDTGAITTGEFLEKWLSDYAVPNTRPRTSERYASDIRLHIKPVLGHIKLTDLRASHIQKLEADLVASGKSATSVRHLHRVLKSALKRAMRWGYVYRNVAEAVDPPGQVHHEIRPPELNQVLELLRLADDTPYGTALTFMARTGCRRGECLGLRWTDIDLENATASIMQTLQRVKREGLIFLPPKSAKSKRAIALDEATVDMLREHRGRQVLQQLELGNVYEDHGLVFPGPFGKPLDPATLTRNFEKLAKKAGIEHVRLHDLRHFHATTLLRTGTHLKIVQERLGHASIAITADTYSHVAPGLQRQAAAAFADLMDSA